MIITKNDIEKIIRETAGLQKTKIEVEVRGGYQRNNTIRSRGAKKTGNKRNFAVVYGSGTVDGIKRTPEGSSLPGFHNVVLNLHIQLDTGQRQGSLSSSIYRN